MALTGRDERQDGNGNGNGHLVQLTAKDFKSDQEVRWCPGCGDYAILARDAELHAGARHRRARRSSSSPGSAARRASRTTWRRTGCTRSTGARRRSRPGSRPSRPDLSVWVVDGRRRRALDRRQPPDPRAAPQRQPQDPALQQPDLRADEGPVLADVRARQGDEVDADGLARPARSTRSRVAIGAEATFVARAIDTDQQAADRGAARGRRSTRARRSSRSSRTATSTTTAPSTPSASDKENRIYLTHGEPIALRRRGEKGVRHAAGRLGRGRRRRRGRRDSCSSTTSTIREPSARVRALAAHARRPSARRRSASSATSSGPSTTS